MNNKSRHSNSRSPQFAKPDYNHRIGFSPLSKYPIEQIQNRPSIISKHQISKLSLQKSSTARLKRNQISKCIDLTPQKKKSYAHEHQTKGEQIEIPVEQIKNLLQKISYYKKKNIQLSEQLSFLKKEVKIQNSVLKVLQEYQ